MTADPVRLEVYKNLFAAIAEEMGASLCKASFSPNIKERRDYSCAIFDGDGNMVAQAAHIPVHLGSMPLSVIASINEFRINDDPLSPGDCIILNDPFRGGTHLPDITLVSPVFLDGESSSQQSSHKITGEQLNNPIAYVANRAHHADIGGVSPGSMPIAREIFQEGLIIPPIKIVKAGIIDQAVLKLILSNVRTPQERLGDLSAQIGANHLGVDRVRDLFTRNGKDEVTQYMHELLDYSERMTRRLISALPDGQYAFQDTLDNDGVDNEEILIKVTISIENDTALVDFTGSASQQKSSVNAVYAITLSAVNYVFRSLISLDVPNNSGCLAPIKIIAPPGSIVNAQHPAPVAGGNVETSQRIVDVLLGALAQACPDQIPAASQGTMNNVSAGGWDPFRNRYFTYYETIGGGMGATMTADGSSAIHSHMTNTLNTPIEALEYAYPIQVMRYSIRENSGGRGAHHGGNGIIRQIKFLVETQITLLTERRTTRPYGLAGGEPGQSGVNQLIHGSEQHNLPGKGSFYTSPGDILSISTPGGGGFGRRDN